ncbi:MAG: DUF6702 family protein [Bacteroidota bacterium]
MKLFYCWIGILPLLLGATFEVHPFFISITDAFYNEEDRSLEITIRMFTDDLEEALEAQGTPKLYLASEKQSEELDKYLRRYMDLHFSVKSKNTKLPYTYLGQEIDMEHTWCYLEIQELDSPRELSITNTLLTDQFDSQRNLVHVKVGTVTKSLLLQKGSAAGSVQF